MPPWAKGGPPLFCLLCPQFLDSAWQVRDAQLASGRSCHECWPEKREQVWSAGDLSLARQHNHSRCSMAKMQDRMQGCRVWRLETGVRALCPHTAAMPPGMVGPEHPRSHHLPRRESSLHQGLPVCHCPQPQSPPRPVAPPCPHTWHCSPSGLLQKGWPDHPSPTSLHLPPPLSACSPAPGQHPLCSMILTLLI